MIDRIVGAVAPREGETIIEIGPGQGALTSRLLFSGARIVAIEFDRDLVPLLQEKFADNKNLVLLEADALALDFCSVVTHGDEARVVANLPYYISTAILQRLIEQRSCIAEMILMLQREVVDRIAAPASTSERGFLSVLVQAYCQIEPLFDVSPAAFRPQPKVLSTVVRLRKHPFIEFGMKDETLLWKVVSAGFAQRRKTIQNNLRSASGKLKAMIEKAGGAGELLYAAGLAPERRAQSLSLEEWLGLARKIEEAGEI